MSPYIKQEKRKQLEKTLIKLGSNLNVKGELTYCIYKLGLEYLKGKEGNYQTISDTIAAMNDAGHEFRRQILDKYEDFKIKENGDIK